MGNSIGIMSSQSATTFSTSDKTPEQHNLAKNPKYLHALKNSIKNSRMYSEHKCSEILQSSNFPARAVFDNNGFVNTVVDCYNRHHNLVIRPDDIWAAIMTQFSFYINKHAEEFRGKFVDFEGKKELVVTLNGSLRSAPYDLFVKLMSKEIDKNLVDPEVKKWILPSFSTTTDNDLVTIGVVFMATMKKYFDYGCCLMCGIPTITLEGTAEDWKDVYGRLEKLKEYKLEKWYDLLEPVLVQFLNAKKGKVDKDFWGKICHYKSGRSGSPSISGWITAFCVFDKDGNWQVSNNQPRLGVEAPKSVWPRLDTNDIPTGIVEVDVKIDDNGTEYNSVMFAGHMAAELKDDGCTLQPSLGWAIALKPASDQLITDDSHDHDDDDSDN